MTMSFWEKNSEILRQKYHGFLEELSLLGDDLLAPEDIKIEMAQSGDPSLCIKGIYVHSPRDPVREGQRLAQAETGGNGPVVILGFGLGYAAQAFADTGRPVIIVEKYRNLLLKALELRDFSDFLSKNRLIFIVGGSGDGIINALAIASELINKDVLADEKPAPSVIRNRALVDLDKEWYGAIEEKIHTWKMKDDVNAATFKRFGRRWVRNLSRNMSAIRDLPGISRLSKIAGEGNFGGSAPVFLAAAGPSLDKTATLLRDIHRRCIVVAVDTSLRFFLRNGVEPDFVLVVDPQFLNSRHLDHLACEKTALVAESAVYPPVLRLPFKKTFLCSSMFPLGTFIEKQVDSKGKLGAGGSVATTAWDFARSLGAKDIWIAGLDLAFPSLKTHFRGARFEDSSNSLSTRFNPVEKWVVRAIRDGFPFKAPCAGGGQVLTDRRLSLYAAWFENQFSKYEQINNCSLFQDGLAINGLKAANIQELLSLPDRREEIDTRLRSIFSQIEVEFNDPQETRKRTERYENAVSGLIRGLKSIKNASEEGKTIADNALKRNLNQTQQNKVMKELDEITKRIANSEVKEVAGFLFPPVEKENATNAGSDPFRAYLKSLLDLFSSLAEASAFNLENINRKL
jgi:hypothetical protein